MTNTDTSAEAVARLRERLRWHANRNQKLGRGCSADCFDAACRMIDALEARVAAIHPATPPPPERAETRAEHRYGPFG